MLSYWLLWLTIFLDDIYNAISTHIVPLMKEKFIFGDECATFLSELTITALESSRAEFPSLFSFFCLDERVNPKFVRSKSILFPWLIDYMNFAGWAWSICHNCSKIISLYQVCHYLWIITKLFSSKVGSGTSSFFLQLVLYSYNSSKNFLNCYQYHPSFCWFECTRYFFRV